MYWFRMLRPALIIMSAGILLNCASYSVPIKLDLPKKPKWPPIVATKFQCVSDGTWAMLDLREAMQESYILQLEAVILSTHGGD